MVNPPILRAITRTIPRQLSCHSDRAAPLHHSATYRSAARKTRGVAPTPPPLTIVRNDAPCVGPEGNRSVLPTRRSAGRTIGIAPTRSRSTIVDNKLDNIHRLYRDGRSSRSFGNIRITPCPRSLGNTCTPLIYRARNRGLNEANTAPV